MNRRFPTLLLLAGALAACQPSSDATPSTNEPTPTEGSADEATAAGDGEAAADQAGSAAQIAQSIAEREDPMSPPPDVAAIPDYAEVTDSGLASLVIREGTGDTHPTASATVTVHYTGWTTDGEMFDSSVQRGEPTSFPLNRVIAGWTEGVQLMVVGEKRRFWIPQDLAYQGRPGPPAGMLVFEVELLDISEPPPPPAVPADVAAPPADADVTASGLASRVLEAGTGTTHPTATSRVRVHYSGWTTDGEMFDSSVVRGQPAEFPLNGVIAGWTEGVQLMVEGETRRFWIPGELAYGNQPGRPNGMLVFDVQLISILN